MDAIRISVRITCRMGDVYILVLLLNTCVVCFCRIGVVFSPVFMSYSRSYVWRTFLRIYVVFTSYSPSPYLCRILIRNVCRILTRIYVVILTRLYLCRILSRIYIVFSSVFMLHSRTYLCRILTRIYAVFSHVFMSCSLYNAGRIFWRDISVFTTYFLSYTVRMLDVFVPTYITWINDKILTELRHSKQEYVWDTLWTRKEIRSEYQKKYWGNTYVRQYADDKEKYECTR